MRAVGVALVSLLAWTLLPQGSAVSFGLWTAALIAVALAIPPERRAWRPDRLTVAAGLLLLVGVGLRAVALTEVPFQVTMDEIIDARIGFRVLGQKPWEMISGALGSAGRSSVTHALQAWPSLFLAPLTGARAASLVLGIVSMVATYGLAAHLFGRRVALLVLAFLAVSHWHIWYSRLGYSFMQGAALVPSALYCLIAGADRRQLRLQYAGGLLLGATLLAYPTARVAVPLFALWVLHRCATRRWTALQAVTSLGLASLGGLLFALPHLRSAGAKWILQRYIEVSAGTSATAPIAAEPGWLGVDALWSFASRFATALSIYALPTGKLAPNDFASTPLLDPVFLGLSVLGLLVAVLRIRDAGHWLVLCFVAVTLIGGQLLTDEPTGAWRAVPLLPALAVAAALGCRALARLLLADARRANDNTFFAATAAVAALVLAGAIPALQSWADARSIDPISSVARFVGSSDPDRTYYFVGLGLDSLRSPVVRFLAGERRLRDVASLADTLDQPQIRHEGTTTFVLDPGLQAAVEPILRCFPGAAIEGYARPGRGSPVVAVTVTGEVHHAPARCQASADGPGLRARYFGGGGEEPLLERVENWPLRHGNELADGVPFDVVEWEGFLRIPVAGPYIFGLFADTADATVTIGHAVALDQANRQVSVELTSGEVPFRLRCAPREDRSFCAISWLPPGGTSHTIQPQFFRPTADGG